jgi:hypothetical protein
MKAIRFLTDYRGVLSDEIFYEAGAVAELAKASVLVNDGRAEFVDPYPLPVPANHKPVKAIALGGLNVQQLKGMAKAAGVRGYSKMRRGTLIKKLEETNVNS